MEPEPTVACPTVTCPTVTCSVCGATATGALLTWSSSTGPRGVQLVCDRCTREHLRSIEGKLDEAWW